ncbi:MAG: hypothetical protein KGJ40_05105 [candidate division NC10 bacterium]|nr:hypothetical protein [candidate division NC10 bacterium]
MAHKKTTDPKAEKKVTRYTYNEIKELRTLETWHTPLLAVEEQVITLPMNNGWHCGSLTSPWEGRTIAAIVGSVQGRMCRPA